MYIIDEIREEIANLLSGAFDGESLTLRIDMPPPQIKADFAVPVFELAKKKGTKPDALANDTAVGLSRVTSRYFTEYFAHGGFVNFVLDRTVFANGVIREFASLDAQYGCSSDEGSGKTIIIDYSAPNIAKPFSVGHLRSTVIGQALYNIFAFLGYTVVGDNHIGDWGTQFGKLMAAYIRWGNDEAINADPINELLALYVRFSAEAKADPNLNDEGRAWFKRLEDGDEEARKLWQWFSELSWNEFDRIYGILGASFDETLGESFYRDMLPGIVNHALESGVAIWEDMPLSVVDAAGDLPTTDAPATKDTMTQVALIRAEILSEGLPEKGRIKTPILIQKKDGASLYATRDLATIKYRMERWKPAQIIYVVGGEQQLYFKQLFRAAQLLGMDVPCVHTWFGLVRLPEGKMSSREGRVIFLEDVLTQAIARATDLLKDRSDMDKDEKERTARMIGVGAIKYADLSQNRTRDIVFDWNRMLSLEGDSAPYLQYAYVRIQSVLRKAGMMPSLENYQALEESEYALLRKIAFFHDAVRKAAQLYAPHLVANYAFELAQAFSTFYTNVHILATEDEHVRAGRLYLCHMTATALKSALGLLGIDCPERM